MVGLGEVRAFLIVQGQKHVSICTAAGKVVAATVGKDGPGNASVLQHREKDP